jgi:dUTP pyrophosphatase
MPMKVKIRRANTNISLPTYGTKDAAAFDIASNEDVTIQPKEIKLIHTGLYFESPPGFFLAIFSRSSTPIKKGLMFPHSVGILDPDYSGPDDEALIMVYNFTDQAVEVKKGDRIAQGIFLPVQQVEWEEAEQLRETTRGGIGSTGI